MAKQVRVYEGMDPASCPLCAGFVKHSKFKHRAVCKLSKKPQDCINTGLCTQWKKEKYK